MNPTQIQLFLNLRAGLDVRRRDPLQFFSWASKQQASLFRYLAQGLEVLAQFGNSTGKTYGAAHGVVAIARGIEVLDGVRLPKLRRPAVIWVLTKTRRAQVDAAQAAYLEALGGHPHEIAWDNRAKNYIDTIWVSTSWCDHKHGTHCGSCSRIVFHCEQSGVETMLGGRVDLIHSDEPPNEKIWREARSRKRAGAQLLLLITATPLYRKDWYWMSVDFTDCTDRPRRGRVTVRSNLDDNRFLSKADKEKLISNWQGDNLFDARRWGDYVDATGMCPFKREWLKRVEARCFEPRRILKAKIETQRDSARGIVLEHRTVKVEQWWPREPGETYWVLCDPSTGVEDATHDPAGIHVYARRRPRLVARYDGYVGAFGLGILAAKLARYYNGAWVDVETNGGYGLPALQALSRRMRYTNLMYREVEAEPGKFREVLGWETTFPLRGQFTAHVQQWLEENSEPHIPSFGVISTLKNITVDAHGKYLAANGRHDEDFILAGRGIYLLSTRPETAIPDVVPRSGMKAALEGELRRPVAGITDPAVGDRPKVRRR